MQIEIINRPGSAYAEVSLNAGESITAEGGAMISMTPNIQINTTTQQKQGGGLLKSVKRLLASESLFFNHFTPANGAGKIQLGTTLPGDMIVMPVSGKKILVQGGSYVASEGDVRLETVWQGAKNFLSGESLFWIELSGEGMALLNAFGVIYPIEVDGDYIVDTGHIVAYEDSLTFNLSKAGSSWMSSILGGEGIVCKFQGKGTVWCQSHSSTTFGQQLTPHLKYIKK